MYVKDYDMIDNRDTNRRNHHDRSSLFEVIILLYVICY